MKNIPASNVWNYDETNFSDDPGRKKAIHRMGLKYPERVINFSKTSTSVIFVVTVRETFFLLTQCIKLKS